MRDKCNCQHPICAFSLWIAIMPSCSTHLKVSFPTNVSMNICYEFVHICCFTFNKLQVFVNDGQRSGFLCIQAVQKRVSLIQQELDQGPYICFNLLFESLLLQLEDRQVLMVLKKGNIENMQGDVL